MHAAVSERSLDYVPTPTPKSTPSRSTRYLVAGIAAATAGVIAVNPVAPTPTALQAEQHAVELHAFVNPLTTLQETLTKTITNLQTLSTGLNTAAPALLQSLGNPAIYAEFAELITANATNPLPLLQVLQGIPGTYGNQITTALQNSSAILNTNLQNLPTIIQNTLGYLQTGQFVEAFSEVNIYVLVQLLERPGAPLFPLFPIPGDIAASIPGGGVLANVFDNLLTRGVAATGLTRALLVAPITAALFVAETLDHVQASFKAGDYESAFSELLSAPIGLVDAFLNGYVPDFPTRSPFQGVLSPNGPLDYFLVDIPTAIANALNLAPQAPPAAPVVTTLAASTPTDIPDASTPTLLKTAALETEPVAEAEPVVETEPVVEAEPVAAEPVSAPVSDPSTPATEVSGSAGEGSQPSSGSTDTGTGTGTGTGTDEDDDTSATEDDDTTSGTSTSGGTSAGSSGTTGGSASGSTGGSGDSGSAGGDSGGTGGGDSGGSDGGSGNSGGDSE